MIGQIAGKTNTIRVGSGGVMLRHYSFYKVAENFRLLSALYPNRIDCGIGRAPGGTDPTTNALAYPNQAINADDHYEDLANKLSQSILKEKSSDNPFSKLPIVPEHDNPPQLWMLGSGASSAPLAAKYGYYFALALFVGGKVPTPEVIKNYRSLWNNKKSSKVMLAVTVICGESDEEAEYLSRSLLYWKVKAYQHRKVLPFQKPEDCDFSKFSEDDLSKMEEFKSHMIIGNPQKCIENILEVKKSFDADEIGVVTIAYDHQKRLQSYELIQKAMH